MDYMETNNKIDFILKKVDTSQYMLAALLGITVRTLTATTKMPKTINKIERFYFVVNEFKKQNISGRSILALIDEYIWIKDDTCVSLHHLIYEPTEYSQLEWAVKEVIKDYK